MAQLEIRNVTRRFGDFVAVDDVSFEIKSGEFFTLLGPSGCGKTTLLRMIAGFDLPDRGSIVLDGVDLKDTPAERRPIHTVFQSYALFPHMTVEQNVAFPLRMAGKDDATIRSTTRAALEQVKLDDKGGRYPHELSGGQKQRVALARGLVNRPRLLLLDEPLGALDAKLREEMQIELINLQREVDITFVYVTHDQTEALALSHRIAVMNHGRVEQLDEPSRIYGAPATRFVADFIGQCNLLSGPVVARDGGILTFDVPGVGAVRATAAEGQPDARHGTVALRPEKIRLVADLSEAAAPAGPHGRGAPHGGEARAASFGGDPTHNHVRGHVADLLYMGDVTVYRVETPGGARIEALLANSQSGRAKFFEVGDAVEMSWAVDAGHTIAG